MKVLAVLAQKGGTGKTTLTVHLATHAASQGLRVRILDIDPQGSSSAWKRRRSLEEPTLTACAAIDLEAELSRSRQAGVDLVLVDTAPHSGNESTIAAQQADLVLIPSRPAILDLEAIGASVAIVAGRRLPAAIMLNACPPRHRYGEPAIVTEAREALQVYGLPVCPVVISQRAAFSHALIDGRAVTEFEEKGKAAGEIKALWQWIEAELKQ